ncbi:hypothetical protein [Sphingosinicella sp. BN140058]|uniref:hypothetical protein n=1 Tax=Sphingosinicella sp. BN140058 TaxID=1892855 RepID=UPI0010101FF0|nr:hypothetical protein [Sphingosinicella sp. BN140058]QAY76038.1 hypothetical protein ETR14_05475 [Sphingosinicella sp. BN140058]
MRKHGLAADPERLHHVQDLLANYPQISAEERGEVLHYLRKAPALDAGLLTGIDAIRPQLDQFRADHRQQLGLQRRDYIVIAVVLLGVAMICALLWDAGIG